MAPLSPSYWAAKQASPTEKGGPRPGRPFLDHHALFGGNQQDDAIPDDDDDQEEFCTCWRYGDFEDVSGCPVHDPRVKREE
jgi:hypothetical protein